MMRTIQGLTQTAKTGNLKAVRIIEKIKSAKTTPTGSLKMRITALGIRRKLNLLKMQVSPAIALIAVSIPYQNPITILIISFQQVVSIHIAQDEEKILKYFQSWKAMRLKMQQEILKRQEMSVNPRKMLKK